MMRVRYEDMVREFARVLEKNGFAVQESFVEDGRESVYLERGC